MQVWYLVCCYFGGWILRVWLFWHLLLILRRIIVPANTHKQLRNKEGEGYFAHVLLAFISVTSGIGLVLLILHAGRFFECTQVL